MIKKILNMIADMPKTLYFNFRVLPFSEALKLPFRISYNTKIDNVRKGVITINAPLKSRMISIGRGGVKGVVGKRTSYIRFGQAKDSKIIFNGNAFFSEGTLISVDRGTLIFGKDFRTSNDFYISCNKKIVFGNDVLVGWSVKILDSDNHTIFASGKEKPSSKEIEIGNHVWIASYADILKGTKVKDNCVVAYRALLTKAYDEENALIGGSPAKIIEKNIKWVL